MRQRNWVFATNSDFLVSISLQSIQCRRLQIFQTMNTVRSNNLSLKYQRLTPSGCKNLGILSLGKDLLFFVVIWINNKKIWSKVKSFKWPCTCRDGNSRFTTVPLKALSDQILIRNSLFYLDCFNCDFSAKSGIVIFGGSLEITPSVGLYAKSPCSQYCRFYFGVQHCIYLC